MAEFIRTTGGLLQLKSKQSVNQDFSRLTNFVQLVGIAVKGGGFAAGKTNPQPYTVTPVASAEPEAKSMDLQADVPEVFRSQ